VALPHAVDIAPAHGKLGVLLPGMGAVATTFMAGVEAIRRGFAKPIGSLTQMGTIRLGKRTDNRSPLIKELVMVRRRLASVALVALFSVALVAPAAALQGRAKTASTVRSDGGTAGSWSISGIWNWIQSIFDEEKGQIVP